MSGIVGCMSIIQMYQYDASDEDVGTKDEVEIDVGG